MTIVSMWSGPRNISTTMMRSFASRSDTVAIDEPFYAHYLARTGADHPYREETLAAHPGECRGVLDWIDDKARQAPILFLKHIAYHLPDETDFSKFLAHKNLLLIRDPAAMIASYSGKYDDVTPIVRSYEIERRIFELLDERDLPCPIIDAADILRSPEAMLRRLCSALGIAFDAAMLSWPKGPKPEDGPWAPHWYQNVWNSTGFRAPVDNAPVLSPELQEIADRAETDYRFLFERRLTA